MKRALIPLMFSVAGVATSQQKSPQLNQPTVTVTTLPGVKIAEAVPAIGTNRVYYTTHDDELFAYDRTSKRSTLVGRGKMSEIALSPRNDRIAFGRRSEDNAKDVHIWTMPLDPATGAAAGPARRVSITPGHAPQFSQNGQRIAFAAKDSAGFDHVAVMPAAGGTERIVDKEPRSLELLRWSSNGRMLYVGDWGKREDPTAAYRIPVDGGTATLIAAKTGSNYPGLSPDGRLMVTINEDYDSLLVATPTGKRLGAIPWMQGADGAAWSGNARLFVPTDDAPWKVKEYSLTDGSTRALTDSTRDVTAPHWSPDGRRIAIALRDATIEVMDADGSGVRAIAKGIPIPDCVWSPDGRWISFKKRGSLSAVEVATGREVTLVGQLKMLPNRGWWSTVAARWAPDSRSLFYTQFLDSIAGFPVGSRYALHEVTLAGTDRALREVTTYRGRGVNPPVFGDSTIELATRLGAHISAPIRSGAPEATLIRESQFGVSMPSFSPTGRRVGYRINPNGPDNSVFSVIEVMQADGAQRTRINVPFNAVTGLHNPMFLPDRNQLLVAGQEKRGGEISFYRVSLNGTTTTKLFTIPAPKYGREDWAYELSPDGKTLLYITDEPSYSTFSEVDLSAFLKLVPVPKAPQ